MTISCKPCSYLSQLSTTRGSTCTEIQPWQAQTSSWKSICDQNSSHKCTFIPFDEEGCNSFFLCRVEGFIHCDRFSSFPVIKHHSSYLNQLKWVLFYSYFMSNEEHVLQPFRVHGAYHCHCLTLTTVLFESLCMFFGFISMFGHLL